MLDIKLLRSDKDKIISNIRRRNNPEIEDILYEALTHVKYDIEVWSPRQNK